MTNMTYHFDSVKLLPKNSNNVYFSTVVTEHQSSAAIACEPLLQFQRLRKRAKQSDVSKIEQNSIREIWKTFTNIIGSIILFGCLEASTALALVCFLR